MPNILLLLILALLIYFLPWIVAHSRHHRQLNSIVVLNTFLGWTLIGWVAALIWALTTDVEKRDMPALKL